MSIKGLEQAIANLNSISKTAVPRAKAQSVNRIATQAANKGATIVAGELKIPSKLMKQRIRIRKASNSKPYATIRVNRGNLPAIKLASDITRISWRNYKNKGTITKVGPLRLQRAFVQILKNGRWHVMQRAGKERYDIDVVKIPTAQPLTTAFKNILPKLMEEKMPTIMRMNLQNQLRVILKR